ncbi:MAG TPA: HAMP domain-containing sensor histidine kinase [Azospirillum sp.]|nr:HAMP domain-containing sensor histidine kinase [Azospirillum sp.]
MSTRGADGAVLVCDRDGRVELVHLAGAGLPGLRPATGAPFPLLFGLEPVGRALDLFTALRRDGAVHDWPLHAALPDGATRVVFLTGRAADGALLLAAAAQPGTAGAVCSAVSQARPELAVLLRPLCGAPSLPGSDALFDEMTILNSQLANAQRALAKANAELEASNAQKGRLLGMLAHDLRTPLQVIGGFAQLLTNRLAGSAEPRDLEALERIRESSLFMRHLIEDVLSMSALQAGRLVLSPRPTDLAALVRRNVAMNLILAQGKGLTIDCEAADGLPPLPLDPPRIEQVMNNLLSNAVKYSDAGTRIRVTVERLGDHVRVAVTDHGRGIAPEQVSKLFQPFSHANTLTDAGDTSVGLGLFIVRSIVEAHGGSVGVESAPGRGSTFHIELPVPTLVNPPGIR